MIAMMTTWNSINLITNCSQKYHNLVKYLDFVLKIILQKVKDSDQNQMKENLMLMILNTIDRQQKLLNHSILLRHQKDQKWNKIKECFRNFLKFKFLSLVRRSSHQSFMKISTKNNQKSLNNRILHHLRKQILK